MTTRRTALVAGLGAAAMIALSACGSSLEAGQEAGPGTLAEHRPQHPNLTATGAGAADCSSPAAKRPSGAAGLGWGPLGSLPSPRDRMR